MWTGKRQLRSPSPTISSLRVPPPPERPKIAVPVPAQQDGPGSMASIYRYYDGLGRGIPFPGESPVWKNKEGKAEIFSFHQNRRSWEEVGDGQMKGGGQRCILTYWWSSGRGAPRPAPARRAPGALGLVPHVPIVGHAWLPQSIFVSDPRAHVPSWT